jgi:hypothetical protein
MTGSRHFHCIALSGVGEVSGADSIAIAFDADGVNQNPMVAVLCGVVKQFGAIANS